MRAHCFLISSALALLTMAGCAASTSENIQTALFRVQRASPPETEQRLAELDAVLAMADSSDVNAKNYIGNSALHYALRTSFLDNDVDINIDALRKILDAGADVDVPNRRSIEILPLAEAIEGGNLKAIALLLEYGANPNQTYADFVADTDTDVDWYHTPFHFAVRNQDRALIALTIRHSIGRRQYGEDPLAVRKQALEIITLLLQHGADTNAIDPLYGTTAIRYAIGSLDTLKLMVKHGADLSIVDRSGESNLSRAKAQLADRERVVAIYDNVRTRAPKRNLDELATWEHDLRILSRTKNYPIGTHEESHIKGNMTRKMTITKTADSRTYNSICITAVDGVGQAFTGQELKIYWDMQNSIGDQNSNEWLQEGRDILDSVSEAVDGPD